MRDIFIRTSDVQNPQVCLGEMREQRISEALTLLPMQPGQPACGDSKDERQGTVHLFIARRLLTSKRIFQVTEHRTKQNWARFIRELADEDAHTVCCGTRTL